MRTVTDMGAYVGARNVLDDAAPGNIVSKKAVLKETPRGTRHANPIRVYMLDLLPTVPYYTGYLCASLHAIDRVKVDVGAVTYYLDRDFFQRRELEKDPGLYDVNARFQDLNPALRRGLKVTEYLSNLVKLLARFRSYPPDVLHVQFLPMVKTSVPAELWFLKRVQRMGIKIVYTVHNVLPQDGGESYRAKYQQIYSLADGLICHDTEAWNRLVQEFQISPDKISIIPHGPLLEPMTATDSAKTRAKLGVDDTQGLTPEAMVLWQGIIKPYKGVSFLLKAWKAVKARGARGRLVIAGTGDAGIVNEIREEVAALGIESSVVLDFRFLSVTEVADYYAAADVITYPYREITTSGALMTGICYGKAIVATQQRAFANTLQDGQNSLIVDYGDVEGLAERLLTLIDQPSLRKSLGEEARKSFLNGPQWDSIANATADCYEKAVAAGHGN